MKVVTEFLRLFKPVALGDRIDGWRVGWVGGWDKYRVLFVVKVERPRLARTMIHTTDSEALTLRLI